MTGVIRSEVPLDRVAVTVAARGLTRPAYPARPVEAEKSSGRSTAVAGGSLIGWQAPPLL